MSASVEFTPIFRDGLVVGYKARYRTRGGQIYNDAMALLMYLVQNPQEYDNGQQSYNKLSEATGIPPTSLKRMIKWHRKNGKESCVLHYVAFKAGILISYDGRPGRIMFARWASKTEQWERQDTRNGGPLY